MFAVTLYSIWLLLITTDLDKLLVPGNPCNLENTDI